VFVSGLPCDFETDYVEFTFSKRYGKVTDVRVDAERRDTLVLTFQDSESKLFYFLTSKRKIVIMEFLMYSIRLKYYYNLLPYKYSHSVIRNNFQYFYKQSLQCFHL
jgi:hypothetical protein